MSARVSPLSRHAVLMIHGLGGTRHDFGALDRKFEQIGCDVHLPSLPGHGSNPDALSRVTLSDYMQLLSRTYRELAKRYERVDVAGISMGALLALMLSARERMTTPSSVAAREMDCNALPPHCQPCARPSSS